MKKRVFRHFHYWLAGLILVALLAGCDLRTGLRPPPPTSVTATVDDFTDRVRITWSAVPGAGAYEIWRSQSEDSEFTYLGDTGYLAFDDFSVVPGTGYWYRVRSCNRFGCGEFSASVYGRAKPSAGPLSPPTGLQASQGTYVDHIHVQWDGVSGATFYEVYRASGANDSFVFLTEVETNSYDDFDVSPTQTYWYKVRACNDQGCSLFSDAVSGYVSPRGLPTPTGVTATDGEYPDKIVITWDAVEGALTYIVYRSENQEGPFEPIAETSETSYEDAHLVAGATYWYEVRACNEDACSGLSDAVKGSTSGGPPPPPSPPG